MTNTQAQTRHYIQRVHEKEENFATVHPIINDLWITLIRVLPYIVAIYIGITFRTIVMTCKGYDYTINGMDILNVVLCVAMVATARFIRKLSK